ncbi:uncharacterized protein [Coffea arabica]|uniref:G-patch domain-containing protein n=1 Tax=Coffea arabica TaxID=13443 RepID=A0ABM4VQC7_COFAR
MSAHSESSDTIATTPSADLTNLGAQLSEVLNKFKELSMEMTAQQRVIDQLVTDSSSGPYYYSTAEPFTLDTAAQGKVEIGESSAPIDKNLLKRLHRFDEFMRKSQDLSKQGGLDYNELCLFPDMQLPVGFKTFKFSKLEGDALDWYSNLKPDEMRTWLDLSTAFVRQYEYNCEFAPTRTTLEGIKRKPSEDHKTYEKAMEEIDCQEIINKLEEYDEFIRAKKIVNVLALKSQLEVLQNQNNNSKKPQFKKKEREALKVAGKIDTIPPKIYPKGFFLDYDPQSFCAYHSGAPGHSTTNCWALKHKIQDIIEAGDIVLRRRDEQGPSVSNNPLPAHKDTIGVITIDEEIDEPTQYIVDEAGIIGVTGEPFILEEETFEIKKNTDLFILDVIPFECEPSEFVVLKLPEQAPVFNLQEVSWNYSEPILLIGGEEMPKKEVAVVTRSGRIISEPAVNDPSKAKENAAPTRPAVTEEKAFNFLRMLNKSEYKVIEQLDKMPTQISMLNLLLTSKLHREVLLKVLTEAQVPKNIPVDKFTHLVEHVLVSNQISFSDKDLTSEGIGHNKNILVKLGFQKAKLRPSATIVRGFDSAKRESLGEVDLVLEIGPTQFQVMNFSSAYNILLGRPRIHASGAIPSLLHQILRFVVNDQLITVFAEDDCTMIVNSGPKEERGRKALVSSHHVADIISVGWVSKDKSVVGLNLLEASVMMAKEMIREGYEIGKGLGHNLQGILEPIEAQGKKDTFGLGFQSTSRTRKM